MKKLQSTLNERGKRYGTFVDNAYISQAIKDVMRSGRNWANMDSDMHEAIDQIAAKLSRIAMGDPSHADNWHDIAGYAQLVENRLNKSNDVEPMVMRALGDN